MPPKAPLYPHNIPGKHDLQAKPHAAKLQWVYGYFQKEVGVLSGVIPQRMDALELVREEGCDLIIVRVHRTQCLGVLSLEPFEELLRE